MATTRPIQIPGRWRRGYALDYHTISSVYVGDDEYGHPRFSTQRSEIGELLYGLKNKSDQSGVAEIVEAATAFVESWNPGADILVPVPASRPRSLQPVLVIGKALAAQLGIPFEEDLIQRTREIPELKNVYDFSERLLLLSGAHATDKNRVRGRRILLVDDLFRSGATMNAITECLYDEGEAAEVFALTITRTRSNR